MSDQQNKMLQDYLERVMAIKERSNTALTEKDLRQIANEVGLSDEDLAAADRAAQEHFQRGINFLDHGRFHDAIEELQEAVALAPGWLEYKSKLASAYLGRWRHEQREPDRYAAASLARECVEIDPNYAPAYEILNETDQLSSNQNRSSTAPPYVQAAASHQRKSGGGGLIIMGVVGGLGIMALTCTGLVGYMFMAQPGSEPAPIYNPTVPSIKTPTPYVAPSYKPKPYKSTYRPKRGQPIKLTVQTDKAPGLELEKTIKSELRVYSTTKDHGFYEGIVILKNNIKSKEITKMSWSIEYRDAQNEVLKVQNTSYLGGFSPKSYRPNDTISLRLFKKVPSSTTNVHLKLLSVKTKKAKKSYPPSKVMSFATLKTVDMSGVTIKERDSTFKKYRTNKTHGYLVTTLEVSSVSEQPIKRIKAEISMLDKSGSVIQTDSWSIVSSLNGNLYKDSTQVVQRTFKAPKDFDQYSIRILEVDRVEE